MGGQYGEAVFIRLAGREVLRIRYTDGRRGDSQQCLRNGIRQRRAAMDRNSQRTVCLQREKRYVEAVSTFSFRSSFIAGQSRVGDLQRLVRNYLDRHPEWSGKIQPTHGQLHRVYIRRYFFRTSCLQRDYLFDRKFAGSIMGGYMVRGTGTVQ